MNVVRSRLTTFVFQKPIDGLFFVWFCCFFFLFHFFSAVCIWFLLKLLLLSNFHKHVSVFFLIFFVVIAFFTFDAEGLCTRHNTSCRFNRNCKMVSVDFVLELKALDSRTPKHFTSIPINFSFLFYFFPFRIFVFLQLSSFIIFAHTKNAVLVMAQFPFLSVYAGINQWTFLNLWWLTPPAAIQRRFKQRLIHLAYVIIIRSVNNIWSRKNQVRFFLVSIKFVVFSGLYNKSPKKWKLPYIPHVHWNPLSTLSNFNFKRFYCSFRCCCCFFSVTILPVHNIFWIFSLFIYLSIKGL